MNENNINVQGDNLKQGNSSLGIAALILTLLGCTSFIGIILAIVDLCNKDGRKKTLSIISLGICAFWFIVIMVLPTERIKRRNKERLTIEEVTTEYTIPEKETQTTTERTISTTELTTERKTEEAFAKTEDSGMLNDSAEESESGESESGESESEESESGDGSSGIRPDFKEMMDSYEAFMDEYVEFMKRMSEDPGDLDILSDYADIMIKYADWGKKIEALDESEMSSEEAAYYTEVTLRVSQKLLEVSATSSD